MLHIDPAQPGDLLLHASAYALPFGTFASMLLAWVKSKGGAA